MSTVTINDRNEITDLVSRLGVVLDEGRFDEMAALLVENATVHTPGGTAEGRNALVAQAIRNHPTDRRTQHVITNLLIDVDPSDTPAKAKVRANLLVHSAPLVGVPAPAVEFTLGEIYRFDVVRTSEGWRFSRVETEAIWMSGTMPPRSRT